MIEIPIRQTLDEIRRGKEQGLRLFDASRERNLLYHAQAGDVSKVGPRNDILSCYCCNAAARFLGVEPWEPAINSDKPQTVGDFQIRSKDNDLGFTTLRPKNKGKCMSVLWDSGVAYIIGYFEEALDYKLPKYKRGYGADYYWRIPDGELYEFTTLAGTPHGYDLPPVPHRTHQ